MQETPFSVVSGLLGGRLLPWDNNPRADPMQRNEDNSLVDACRQFPVEQILDLFIPSSCSHFHCLLSFCCVFITPVLASEIWPSVGYDWDRV